MIKTITAVYLRALVFTMVLSVALCTVFFYSCGDSSIVHKNSLQGITGSGAGTNPLYSGGIKDKSLEISSLEKISGCSSGWIHFYEREKSKQQNKF